MTLKEMKIKTFSLIEEYYPNAKGMAEDEDVLNKINGIVNQIQLDLMKYRKIMANEDIKISKLNDRKFLISDYLDDCYQLNTIRFDKSINYEMPDDNTIILPDDYEGTFTIYYYKYPKLVKTIFDDEVAKEKEDNNYRFELDVDLLEIMPYGIAADLLKMDMISNYGKYFYERYLEMKNGIDPRKTSGIISVVGGIDV